MAVDGKTECKTKLTVSMNKMHKQYNIIMVLLGITGLLLVFISFFVADKNTERFLEWPGFIMFWSAVIMKFLHPKLRTGKTKAE